MASLCDENKAIACLSCASQIICYGIVAHVFYIGAYVVPNHAAKCHAIRAGYFSFASLFLSLVLALCAFFSSLFSLIKQAWFELPLSGTVGDADSARVHGTTQPPAHAHLPSNPTHPVSQTTPFSTLLAHPLGAEC